MTTTQTIYSRLLKELDLTQSLDDAALRHLIRQAVDKQAEQTYISLEEKLCITKELFNAFRGLDILQELLEDDRITEIMINGARDIFIERDGRLLRSSKKFLSREKLDDIIQQIVSGSNRYVNESSPIVDARLADGSRVNVVLSPVALNGPVMTIRKFPKDPLSMERLIELGSLSHEAAAFLQMAVRSRYNLFISGGTGAGKTTFLNALSSYIPSDERIITIEDNAELQIHGISNLVRLEAKNANLEGEGEITIRQLIRTALRMRPDRIIVGEVRGDETVDMISSAMLNGHNGSMSTGHGNTARDMIKRLETMMLMGLDLPFAAIERQIASALDIVIHLGRLRDKSRRVLEICEVDGCDQDGVRLHTLYQFQEEDTYEGKIKGRLVKVGELQNKDKLLAAGYHTD